MKLKDKLVKKLVNFGKKHRLMVYPTLALIAIISAISSIVCWGKGQGKRAVASLMVVTLLIVQSVFLTSDAAAGDDGGNDGGIASDGDPDMGPLGITPFGVDPEINVVYHRVDENGVATEVGSPVNVTAVPNADGNSYYTIPLLTDNTARVSAVYDASQAGYFESSECFENIGLTTAAKTTIKVGDPEDDGQYDVYFSLTRTKYPLVVTNTGATDKNLEVEVTKVERKVNPSFAYTVADAATYGAYKTGYTYTGLNYNGSYTQGQSISIAPTISDTTITMSAEFEAQTIDIPFLGASDTDKVDYGVKVKTGGNFTANFNYTYDQPFTFPDVSMNGNVESEAYYIGSWNVGGNTYAQGQTLSAEDAKVLINALADKTLKPNIEKSVIQVTPNWVYKDIVLSSSSSELSVNGVNATLTSTYGDTLNASLGAVYNYDKEDSSKFHYSISDADNTILSNYGISYSPITEGGINKGIRFQSTGITNVTTSTVQITVKITDDNKPGFEQPCVITLDLKPKAVTIVPESVKNSTGVSAPYKDYDGNQLIDVTPSASLDGIINNDNVTVSFDSSATLDSANAGSGKDVTLTTVTLGGTDSAKYTIDGTVTVPGIGTINQKLLTIEMELMTGQNDTIKFGMETPKYILKLSDDSIAKLTATDQAQYAAMDSTAFIEQYLGFTGWSTGRKLYSMPGTYTIIPNIDSTGKNYTATASGLSKSFTVTRDDGTAEHILQGTLVNGYYKGLSIKPDTSKNYDKIRLIPGGSDITETYTKDQVNALDWKASIDIDDMDDGTIYFQMMDSSSGAITSVVKIEHLYVDKNGPELKVVGVAPHSDIKDYIKNYGFGSYYHSQTINGTLVEQMTITLYYNASESPCKVLHYYFVAEDGTKSGESQVNFEPAKENGYYVAKIYVGTAQAQRGQLVAYAEDQASNTSTKDRIRFEDYDELSTVGNYYEWMVENNIEDAVVDVTDADGVNAVSDTWYNKLNFTVDAADSDSGVNSIEWSVKVDDGYITPAPSENVSSIKRYSYSFVYSVNSSSMPAGAYTVGGTVRDNAGNEVVLDEVGPFNIDCINPEITVDAIVDPTIYQSGVDFGCLVTEGVSESGIAKVTLYKKEGNDKIAIKVWTPSNEAEKRSLRCDDYRIVNKGTYIIEAQDIAGNISTEERTFTKLSTTVPEEPVIDVNGVDGNNGWFKGDIDPEAIITFSKTTTDGVPVTNRYKLTTATSSNQETIDTASPFSFDLTEQGEVTIEAWGVSESGISSAVAKKTVKIDTVKPTVEIVNATVDGDGSVNINFRAKDETSGVDTTKVLLNGEPIAVTPEEKSVVGSFKADGNQIYTIEVQDIAGNISDVFTFKPLQLVAAPVTDITETTAFVEADVIIGTYDLSEVYIAYKKHDESSYRTALFNKTPSGDTVHLECTFRDLVKDTEYDYRIYASSEKAEVKIAEGTFRTLNKNATGMVYGTVTYDPQVANQDYPVYVSLYSANTIVASKKLESSADIDYKFTNLKDGSYSVVATNGVLVETKSVTIEKGGIIAPADYAAQGGVNLVLNGYNTAVKIDDNAICLTADDLESLYDNSIYKGILTDDDIAVLQHGGKILMTLHANYTNVNDISPAEQKILASRLPENAVIERYIELSVVKEVWDANGSYVNGTPMEIHELYDPITVSFPLGDLAGQKIYVASVHQNGLDFSFMNWSDAGSVNLSQNYATIKTRFFSTYVLYRIKPTDKTFKVTWKDGNGTVLKTEYVKDGNAAVPPTGTPTKKESDKYTYKFSGWDTDYSTITKDVVISAWFTAQAKPTGNTTNPKPADITPPTDNGAITTQPNAYTYLGSADSPKTGDETPIVLLLVAMIGSGAGMMVLRKRNKQ